jgi:hypothetical protein
MITSAIRSRWFVSKEVALGSSAFQRLGVKATRHVLSGLGRVIFKKNAAKAKSCVAESMRAKV